MKKVNITSILLLIYLVVMAVIGWPGSKAEPDWGQYALIIGVTLAAILLLRFVQIKRVKHREKLRKGIEPEESKPEE